MVDGDDVNNHVNVQFVVLGAQRRLSPVLETINSEIGVS